MIVLSTCNIKKSCELDMSLTITKIESKSDFETNRKYEIENTIFEMCLLCSYNDYDFEVNNEILEYACNNCNNAKLKYQELIKISQINQYYVYYKKYSERTNDPLQLILAYNLINQMYYKTTSENTNNNNFVDLFNFEINDYMNKYYYYDFNTNINYNNFSNIDQTAIEESYVLLLSIFQDTSYQFKLSNDILSFDLWIKIVYILSKNSLLLFYNSPLSHYSRNIPNLKSFNERVNALNKVKVYYNDMINNDSSNILDNHTIKDMSYDNIIEYERITIRLAQVSKLSNDIDNNKLLTGSINGEMEKNPFQKLGRRIIVLLSDFTKLNHSCIPNISIDPIDDNHYCFCNLKVKAIALRDININDELTRNYLCNSSYITTNKYISYHKRMKLLKKYNIHCKCILCIYESLEYINDNNINKRIKLDNKNDKYNILPIDYITIASYYMSINKRNDAINLYYKVINKLTNNNHNDDKELLLLGDCYYAIGLIDYESMKWLDGLKNWIIGYSLSSKHKQLSDQYIKIQSYIHFYYYQDINTYNNIYIENYIASKFISNDNNYNQIIHNNILLPIFLSNLPVLNILECNKIIKLVEDYSLYNNGWTTSRHYSIPTTDIPIHIIPEVLQIFNNIMKEYISSMIINEFKNNKTFQNVNLCVHDAFIVKYEQTILDSTIYEILLNDKIYKEHPLIKNQLIIHNNIVHENKNQRYLPLHSDQSSHSFIIPLNSCNEFIGGGTYFSDLKKSINPDIGHILSFDGNLIHGGDPLLYGKRYIIAAFLYISYNNDNNFLNINKSQKDHLFDFNF